MIVHTLTSDIVVSVRDGETPLWLTNPE